MDGIDGTGVAIAEEVQVWQFSFSQLRLGFIQ